MREFSPYDMQGVLIGHATDDANGTGCTAIICPEGAIAGVDVRGGGPATRETDLLRPENMVQKIHAVMLSGGSAFGLEAASGAMRYLEERDIGFDVGVGKVPIVCGASIFDLACGNKAYPDVQMGYAACEDAFAWADDREGDREDSAAARGSAAKGSARRLEGCVGAGAGATVGKVAGPARAMKSGLGAAGFELDGLQVAAIAVVNAVGTVLGDDGAPLAGLLSEGAEGILGARDAEDAFLQVGQLLFSQATGVDGDAAGAGAKAMENTTISCVVANAAITKAQAAKVASMAHDGYARAIRPVHTSNDGDTIFIMATGAHPAPMDVVGVLAANACEAAIRRAITCAVGAYGYKARCDFR